MTTRTAAVSLVFCVAGILHADPITTINFGTGVNGPGTSESNDYNGTNVATIPAGAWAAPIGSSTWESIQADSLNPAIPNGTLVDFSFIFGLGDMPGSGALGIMVDDSADVLVNGTMVVDDLGSPQGTNCAAALPGCLSPLTLDISAYLVGGANRVDVIVSQDGNYQFGVDVYGTASSSAPEPGTLGFLLIGLGLLGKRIRERTSR